MPEAAARPMIELLLSRGYQAIASDIMALGQVAPRPVAEMEGVKIIPARASFRHMRQLFEEDAAEKTPQLAEANMMHLDDPHWDSLLALKDGAPLAWVCWRREIGRIESVYVARIGERFGRADDEPGAGDLRVAVQHGSRFCPPMRRQLGCMSDLVSFWAGS
jgi:hypothetical protein